MPVSDSPDNDTSVTRLRKADFWTSLVLLTVASGMLLKTYGMPLEGTYAGVRNAWYVSPALFPLVVATALIVLSGILLLNAVRSGGARAALEGVRHPQFARFWSASGETWIAVGILGGYIYALVPRVDFLAATTLLLFTLVAVYDLGSPRAAGRALGVFAATVFAVALVALAGVDLPPRSSAAHGRDALVWGAVLLSMLCVAQAARTEAASRPRLARCIWVSVLTPFVLGTIFKYGLLVPLPVEGITVEILDRIRYGAAGLLSR